VSKVTNKRITDITEDVITALRFCFIFRRSWVQSSVRRPVIRIIFLRGEACRTVGSHIQTEAQYVCHDNKEIFEYIIHLSQAVNIHVVYKVQKRLFSVLLEFQLRKNSTPWASEQPDPSGRAA